jgi:hypothetical protein
MNAVTPDANAPERTRAPRPRDRQCANRREIPTGKPLGGTIDPGRRGWHRE